MQTLPGLSTLSRFDAAFADIQNGIANYHVWGLLGWQDIRQRYRRSVIGPFWVTISTGIMVGSIGFLFARILNQDVGDYLPYLAVGLIIWSTLSTVVNESCTVFISAEQIIKQTRLPLTTHVCRLLWRNVIIFAHNAVILVPIALWSERVSVAAIWAVPLGVLLLMINGLWTGLVLGVLCARFRDIPQIVVNLMQIGFFLTPILWKPEVLGGRMWAAEFNPLYHLIEVIRAPLLGNSFPVFSWGFAALFTLCGMTLALLLLARFRTRVPYWI